MRSSRSVVVLWLTCTGCMAGPTSVSVELDATDEVRADTRSLALTVLGGEDREARFYHELDAADLQWPVDLVLSPASSGRLDAPFRVSVRAFGPEGGLVSSRFLAGHYVPGEVGRYRLLLDPDCAGVLCNEVLDETCSAGACVSGAAAPEVLP